MSKQKLTFWQVFKAVATLGALAVVWFIAIEVAVIIISGIVGIIVTMFHGLVPGLAAAIFSYFGINKILWWCDIFEMITAGRSPRGASKLPRPPAANTRPDW